MEFKVLLQNELPFMIELKDDTYEVKIGNVIIKLEVYSDFYKLFYGQNIKEAGKMFYGDAVSLYKMVKEKNIESYGYDKSKTFIRCKLIENYDLNGIIINSITDKECIAKLKSDIILDNEKYEDIDELNRMAENRFRSLDFKQRRNINIEIVKKSTFQNMTKIDLYYRAINKFIEQYQYIRKLSWGYNVNENILNGTQVINLCDNNFFSKYTYGGIVPSIIPTRRVYKNMEDEKYKILKNRLKSDYDIPIESMLIQNSKVMLHSVDLRFIITN